MTVVRIQIRRDTAADWTSINPTLRAGELGYETDTSNLKIGDGVTAWTSLAYFTGSSGATWGTITGTLSSQTDLQSALDLKAAISSLATVATSGAYVDLTGAPTISAYGLTLIDDADAVTARTTLGLGTAATQASSAFAAASHTHTALAITSELPFTTNYTPGANLNEYLFNIDTAFGSYVLSSAISAFGATLVDDADAAAARTTLGAAAATHTHAKVKAIVIPEPVNTDDITLFFTDEAITVTQLNAVIRGTTPSATWTVRFAADRSATGTEVVTGGTTTTSQTTGSEITVFNDATIDAGSWVWVEVTAISGTVDELNITLTVE